MYRYTVTNTKYNNEKRSSYHNINTVPIVYFTLSPEYRKSQLLVILKLLW